MSINAVIQILVDLIIGLMLSAVLIATRRGPVLSLPNGGMVPFDAFEWRRLGLQILNMTGGVSRG